MPSPHPAKECPGGGGTPKPIVFASAETVGGLFQTTAAAPTRVASAAIAHGSAAMARRDRGAAATTAAELVDDERTSWIPRSWSSTSCADCQRSAGSFARQVLTS